MQTFIDVVRSAISVRVSWVGLGGLVKRGKVWASGVGRDGLFAREV